MSETARAAEEPAAGGLATASRCARAGRGVVSGSPGPDAAQPRPPPGRQGLRVDEWSQAGERPKGCRGVKRLAMMQG